MRVLNFPSSASFGKVTAGELFDFMMFSLMLDCGNLLRSNLFDRSALYQFDVHLR